MADLTLVPMTDELHHAFYRGYENEPDLYMDESKCPHFVYTPQWVEAYIARQKEKGRLVFAVLEDSRPVGEVVLKNIDRDKKECAFGIVLQNDSVKNRGIGTQAEKLMVDYAIDRLGMETVYADAILKNKRSQHVLQKVGFVQTGADDTFLYYKYQRK